jgi:small GTP-binding protein
VTTIAKKVCLLGDFAVGKTSLIRRFVYSLFDDKYISTIGVKVSRKTVAVPRDRDIVELTMMLWDLAGSEEFGQVRASYVRGAAGAALVCDLTRPETLDSLQTYVDDLLDLNPNAQVVLAANKSDLITQQKLAPESVKAVAAALNAPCFLTSAKTGLFRHLARLLVTEV